MKTQRTGHVLATVTGLVCLVGLVCGLAADPPGEESQSRPAAENTEQDEHEISVPEPSPTPEFVHKGIKWLIEAQHEDGGWGGGSHAQQQIRDPHAVPTDPATTAFVASALLRAGHTPTEGEYKDAVRKATLYLVRITEDAPRDNPRITTLEGTQPQTKLGPLVDTSMTAQYLARVLTTIPKNDALHRRVDAALESCLAKLTAAQKEDGSWNVGGGWAPVLQSSLATSSFELAEVAGKMVDRRQLERARDYQKGNFDTPSGTVKAGDGAGVALYALSSAQRANAGESRAAEEIISKAKDEGVLPADAAISTDNLQRAGVEAPQAQRLAMANAAVAAQTEQLTSDAVLAGFGSNGGEEFLSYLFTSESLVIQGGESWETWNTKMHERLAKIQNPDGSWSGHHCITSPVFCTAAVVQCLSTDRDAKLLIQIAQNAARADKAAATAQADD